MIAVVPRVLKPGLSWVLSLLLALQPARLLMMFAPAGFEEFFVEVADGVRVAADLPVVLIATRDRYGTRTIVALRSGCAGRGTHLRSEVRAPPRYCCGIAGIRGR